MNKVDSKLRRHKYRRYSKLLKESKSTYKKWQLFKNNLHKIRDSGKATIFVKCSRGLLGRLMSYGKVFISWEQGPNYEDKRIPQSKNCFSYGHKEK